MLRSISKEPLTHFLVLALAIFALYGALNRSSAPRAGEIVITVPKIEQLAGLFAKTWQRPPTPSEMKGLIDDFVKEEIFYREALALGLDKDDTVIRRRLRLKMEFMSSAAAEAALATDADLEAYLKANPGKFEIDAMVAFQQIFLNPEKRGEKAGEDAAAVLETLRSNPSADPSTLGDATLLPPELPLTSGASISQTFGADFAAAVSNTAPGAWTGPIKSSFGLHLIHVSAHNPGRVPALTEVRDAVAREWSNEKRKVLEEQHLAELLKRYTIKIEAQPGDTARTEQTP